jgi:hypothetical protein
MSRSSKGVCMAPMAVASDGSIMINAVEFSNDLDPEVLAKFAVTTGAAVFVGLVVPPRLIGRLRKDLDDAAADIAGRLGPRLLKRSKRRT